MPWLIYDKVLFVHVPRCGGTSITKHHKVGSKARKNIKNPFHKFGIMYYYYRYKLYETANFPLFTYENALALVQVVVGIFVYFFVVPPVVVPYIMWSMACTTFFLSTIIITAPFMMRVDFLRYGLMLAFGYVLCGFGSEEKYIVGTNMKGYLFHFTAEKMVRYGYVTPDQLRRCSFSIVRNPYSRMVSMYEYNKRGIESFDHFVKDFYKRYFDQYVRQGTTECNVIYCHILPMHAYTHQNGEQIVTCVIKQEHLKQLVSSNWEGSHVPEDIQKALTGIPHANKRTRRVSWQQYYTQETMNMVYEMYKEDFEIFGYEITMPGRPDLHIVPPVKSMASISHDEVDDVRVQVNKKYEVNRAFSKMDSGDSDEVEISVREEGARVSSPSGKVIELKGFGGAVPRQAGSCEAGQPTHEPTHEPAQVSEEEELKARRDAAVFVLAQT